MNGLRFKVRAPGLFRRIELNLACIGLYCHDFCRTCLQGEIDIERVCGLDLNPSLALGGKTLRLHDARPVPGPMPPGATPGTVSVLGKRAFVATGSGTLELVNAQVEGKKPLMAQDLINGRVLTEGLVLGT